MMKVWLLVLASVISLASCDHSASSYGSLPYEQGGYQAPNSYAPPPPQAYGQQTYTESDDYDDDKDFDLGKMVSSPFKAFQGMFDGVKSALDEIKGSLFVAQGTFLKHHGENVLIKAYKHKSKPYEYYEPPFEYYPPPSYSYPPPAPYQAPVESYQAPIDSYEAPIDHYEGRNSGGSKGFDLTHGGSQHKEVHNNIDSSYASVPHRRNFIEQRSARSRSFSYPTRNQRDYSVGLEDTRPIPVPVPIYVQPSRLVFPVFQHNQGY